MPSQYPYRQTIHNEYLGVSKVVLAMTVCELEWLVEAQLSKSREQEARKRQQRQMQADREAARQHTDNLRSQAEEDTKAAQQNLEAFRTILTGSLGVNLALDWDKLLDRRSVPPFQFDEPKPNRDEIRLQILGPKPTEKLIVSPVPEGPGFLEMFLPFLRWRRLDRVIARIWAAAQVRPSRTAFLATTAGRSLDGQGTGGPPPKSWGRHSSGHGLACP
jgi:hypothetical protein